MSDDPARQPNILLILADQLRWDYLGIEQDSPAKTPNLDALASSGVRFRQCITNSPVCVPARIGLATGLEPHRLGSLHNDSYLPLQRTSYYQRLRDHGYLVGLVGKLDLAKPTKWLGMKGQRPCTYAAGFTHPFECEGKMSASSTMEPHGPYGHWLQEQGLWETFRDDYVRRSQNGWIRDVSHDSPLPAEAWEDMFIGRKSVEWIETVDESFPWHLCVQFVGPHDPFDPPSDYASLFRDMPMPPAIESSMEDKPRWVRNLRMDLGSEKVAHVRRQYCAEMAAIDDAVGSILDAVRQRGMMDNTIVVVSSDHGEMLGDHGLYKKELPYEGAIRVPLTVTGPGVDGGRVSDALVEFIDLNPTICELAGLEPQEQIDARSVGPILRAEATTHRSDTVCTLRNWRCIRSESHKLIQSYNDLNELYNLREDPQETRNLIHEQPEIAKALAKRLQERSCADLGLR